MPAQTAIPRSDGKTLSGVAVQLPDVFAGNAGVLVVGFSRASQGQVASWGRRLAADGRNLHGTQFFEMPMLAGAPRILRGMIVSKMASSVPEQEKPHFMPMMENEAAWRGVAQYSKPDDAYVLLVDGSGNVYWQTEGEATDAAYSELMRNIARVTHNRVHD